MSKLGGLFLFYSLNMFHFTQYPKMLQAPSFSNLLKLVFTASSFYGKFYVPNDVEKQDQVVSSSLVGPDDENVQVHGDGHGPKETAGIGEGGNCSLSDALGRVGAENSPDSEGVGHSRQPVRRRQVDEQLPGCCPQIWPDYVGEDDQRGPHERQSAGAQHDNLLVHIYLCLVLGFHRLRR